MSKIRINRFGPIRQPISSNNGWIDIKKVTVFIGNQGSGKSTIAKLISTFSWMEKVIIRGDYPKKHFTDYNRFRKTFCAYHRIENYFFDSKGNDIADFEFQGEVYSFCYRSGKLTINKYNNSSEGALTQIMYIPAERNFVSAVKKYSDFKELSPSLNDFASEFTNAKKNIKEPISLPINNVSIEYDSLNDIVNIKGNDYKVRLTEASSGFQSVAPLYIVSQYYANLVRIESVSGSKDMSSDETARFKEGFAAIWENEELSDEQRRLALSVLTKSFNKQAFINIVEEPEQNLFPASQKQMLHSLLSFNNYNKGNKLILTTHSPYIINDLTVVLQATAVYNCLKSASNQDAIDKLNKIVNTSTMLRHNDLSIYELNEGVINPIETYDGLPSDNNTLNSNIEESNVAFGELLELLNLCQ